MKTTWYRFGRFMGQSPKLLVLCAALGLSVASAVVWRANETSVSPTSLSVPKLTAEQLARAQAAAAEAQQAKCVAELPAAEKLAAKHLKQGDPSAAEDALRDCDKHLSAAQRQLQTQAAQARVKQWQDSIAKQEKNRLAAAKQQGVSIGMSTQQVMDSNWGRPRKVNTTTTANTVRQQWVYDGGYLYFEDGVLRSIQD